MVGKLFIRSLSMALVLGFLLGGAGSVRAQGLVLTSLPPCVAFDTRSAAAGKMGDNEARTFHVVGATADFSSQGGTVGGCGIPGFSGPDPVAVAVVINLVAIGPDSNGNLKIWATDVIEPNGGVVNYAKLSPNLNNSNALISGVRLDTEGSDVTIRAKSSVHARGVILGYFTDISLTGAGIQDGSITSAHIQDSTITAADLATNSVGASEISTGAVGSSEVADNSLTAADLAPNSVSSSEIAVNAVGTSEVADNSLTAADLAPNSVGLSEISAGAVTSSEVADGSLTAADLATNSVGALEIAADAVGSAEILNGSVTFADHGWASTSSIVSNCGTFATAQVCPAGVGISMGALIDCDQSPVAGGYCEYDSGCTGLSDALNNCGDFDVYLRLN